MASKPIHLWLDDLRDPNLHGYIGWTWVKTAPEAIALLATGTVVRASLDHDLTVAQTMGQQDGEPTGYDVLVWMRDHRMWPPNGVDIHTQNPWGRRRMMALLQSQ